LWRSSPSADRRESDAFDQLSVVPGVNVSSSIPTPYDDVLLTAKVDFAPSAGQTLAARFAFQDQSSPNDQIPVPATADVNNGNTNTTRNYDFVGGHTSTLGSSRINYASFHFQDFNKWILPNVTGVPFLDFPSVDTGPNVSTPQKTTIRKDQLRDDFTMQSSAHALKFGANYIHTKLGGYFYFGASGYTVA
jgi:hypothetical protein